MIAQKYNVLFLDIETAPLFDTRKIDLPEPYRAVWMHKMLQLNLDKYKNELADLYGTALLEMTEEERENKLVNYSYFHGSALYPELSQIVSISIAIAKAQKEPYVYCFYNEGNEFNEGSEKEMLLEFYRFCQTNYCKPLSDLDFTQVCAFNGKNFDFPFIIKRMIINRIKTPTLFSVIGKKPWEITQFIDPYDTWKFGGNTSCTLRMLNLSLFGTDCKDDMDGSQVGELWFDNATENKERISNYCNTDTRVLANIFFVLNDLV